jgi:hypothetical protein
MEKVTWLLLLYALPKKTTSARVNLWRKLRKFGAIQLKTSAYVLPDNATHYERFQWLSKRIRDDGGEATLIRVAEIEGMPHEQVRQQFNAARAKDCQELMRETKAFIERRRKSKDGVGAGDLEKLQKWFNEIKEIDYFNAPKTHEAQMLLQKAEKLLLPKRKPNALPLLNKNDFQNKTWLTRPRPGIDRVGSAWLIREFIDAKAKFVFSMEKQKFPNALPFDMADVEFSHHGDDCSFETLVKRFGISDKAIQRIGEMIHDADLEDGKFQRVECIGLNAVFEGWAKMGLKDDEILSKGSECFAALYHRAKK